MEKKLFFELKDNCEMNVTCHTLETCIDIMESHIYVRDKEPVFDADEYEYTITPVFLTDEEYEALGESDSY